MASVLVCLLCPHATDIYAGGRQGDRAPQGAPGDDPGPVGPGSRRPSRHISKVEQRNKASMKTIRKLAKFFKCDPADLFIRETEGAA
jgi:hypothetical protein